MLFLFYFIEIVFLENMLYLWFFDVKNVLLNFIMGFN